jgi:hypothetical protein
VAFGVDLIIKARGYSLPVLVTVVGERDLVIFVVLLAEVQLHAGTFEDPLGLAGCLVNDGRDTPVRCSRNIRQLLLVQNRAHRIEHCAIWYMKLTVNFKEPWLLLLVLAELELVHFILEA